MDLVTFRKVAEQLLKKHYGLTLADTYLEDEKVATAYIDAGERPYQAVAEHAQAQDLHRVDFEGEFGVPSKDPITQRDEITVLAELAAVTSNGNAGEIRVPVVLNDGYAESFLDGAQSDFDAIEIHGVRNLKDKNDPEGTQCEIDDTDPETFSTYARLKIGEVYCVGDFGTYTLAKKYAQKTSDKYGLPVHDFLPIGIKRKLTENEIVEMAEEALDAAGLVIQTAIGQTDGGPAGVIFSDGDVHQRLVDYIKYELMD